MMQRYEVKAPFYDKNGNMLGIGITTEDMSDEEVERHKRDGTIISARKLDGVM